MKLAKRFNILELAYDRTFAGELVRNLQDEGMDMVEFGQGFISMGPAAAEFMRLLMARELCHGGNPVATWCASNVAVRLTLPATRSRTRNARPNGSMRSSPRSWRSGVR